MCLAQPRARETIDGYLRYKEHVCRQVYADTGADMEKSLTKIEGAWPRYEEATLLLKTPEYQKRNNGKTATSERDDDQEWLRCYLGEDVQELQMHKQHHIHLLNEETGLPEPLPGCRRKDKPKECKSDFPRTRWLTEKAVVLCAGLLRKMGLASTGRRSKLGALHGPMNHESLNGTHPAMLAAQRFNSDVQLPYRFPILEGVHMCDEECADSGDRNAIIEAAQCSQDAQAGYACDYCTKRQPMAFSEVKECCKGHATLSQKITGERLNYIGKRHVTRLMCDAYGKGVVRGQVESTNLRAFWKENTVTNAECIKTCQSEAFYGREYVDIVEAVCDKKLQTRKAIFGEIDYRNKRKRKVTFRDVAMLYGHRPKTPEVWALSPYEFTTYWEPMLLSYPQSTADEKNAKHHACLTESGRAKLKICSDARRDRQDLEPGADYVVKDEGGVDWLAYPDTPATAHFRHTWILRRRTRPKAPSFAGSPIPRHRAGEAERAAMIVATYFRAWTLRGDEADEEVVYCGRLRAKDDAWQDSLKAWLDGGIPCQESKRYIGNFMSVYRVRPRDMEDDEAHTSDAVSDEELQVKREQLEAALESKLGGRGRAEQSSDSKIEGDDASDSDAEKEGGMRENSKAGMTRAQEIWKADTSPSAGPPTFRGEKDVDNILHAARQSQRNERSLNATLDSHDSAPRLTKLTKATPRRIRSWLKELKSRKNEKGQLYCNARQYDFVNLVAGRVLEEMNAEANGLQDHGEPLRWCLHGGPGTGKTHALKILREELFQNILHWDMGVQFQMVALQAVMAELLGGDTIHHACGIPAFRRHECHDDDLHKHLDVAKKVLQWRWLIIDEISMVSAKLLAEMDLKLQRVVRRPGDRDTETRLLGTCASVRRTQCHMLGGYVAA